MLSGFTVSDTALAACRAVAQVLVVQVQMLAVEGLLAQELGARGALDLGCLQPLLLSQSLLVQVAYFSH